VLLHCRLLLYVQFLFCFGGGRPLHNVQFLIFSNSTEDPSSRFAICSLKVFSNNRSALFLFLSAAAVLCLDPEHQCYLPDQPDASSRTPVLFGYHLQIYFCSDPSVVLVRPTVLYDFIPCAVPLLHSGSSLFRLRRTPFAVQFPWF
jgi:hypothetical protein